MPFNKSYKKTVIDLEKYKALYFKYETITLGSFIVERLDNPKCNFYGLEWNL